MKSKDVNNCMKPDRFGAIFSLITCPFIRLASINDCTYYESTKNYDKNLRKNVLLSPALGKSEI